MSYKTKPTKIPCEYQRRVNRSSKLNDKPCFYTKGEAHHVKNRSCSTTSIINNVTTVAKPKKTTKSDCVVSKDNRATPKLNRCQACGDTAKNPTEKKKSNVFISMNGIKNSGVQQFFRNKNFRQSSASVYGTDSLKVTNLNTIKESEENIERTASDVFTSEDDEGKTASDIKELKKFRQENYFECHSAAAKLKNLEDHRCVYRFYLNERLFPVPISADYNNVIRCTECHLPLEGNKNINGTIQAKVKINEQLQDMMLMLPARKSLIIQERRKEKVERREDEPLYFGIVRLGYRDSVFRSYPSDSLALRYQKGYQDLMNRRKYEYERVKEEDVIVI